MIRVNRNHPSIINWSMGNEVFFTNSSTQNKAKALVNKMRNKAHELDPTRKAGMVDAREKAMTVWMSVILPDTMETVVISE